MSALGWKQGVIQRICPIWKLDDDFVRQLSVPPTVNHLVAGITTCEARYILLSCWCSALHLLAAFNIEDIGDMQSAAGIERDKSSHVCCRGWFGHGCVTACVLLSDVERGLHTKRRPTTLQQWCIGRYGLC